MGTHILTSWCLLVCSGLPSFSVFANNVASKSYSKAKCSACAHVQNMKIVEHPAKARPSTVKIFQVAYRMCHTNHSGTLVKPCLCSETIIVAILYFKAQFQVLKFVGSAIHDVNGLHMHRSYSTYLY